MTAVANQHPDTSPRRRPRSADTTPHHGTSAPRGRVATLIDLENLAHDNQRHLDLASVNAICDRLAPLTAEWPTTVALQTGLLPRYLPCLARRPWRLILVPSSPDAADLALMDAGRSLVATGCTDLVIVSGDRRFAALARSVRLHVVSYGDRVSHKLTAAATTVTYLDHEPSHPNLPGACSMPVGPTTALTTPGGLRVA